ncbi:MAG: hypothetical protein V1725_06860 [archaeon]
MTNKAKIVFIVMLVLLCSCTPQQSLHSRQEAIPETAVKITPDMDSNPPQSFSDEYADPVPIPVIDTAGAEDSAFIMPDGKTLYFFFTPDVNVPVERQLFDGSTGIYVARKTNGWSEPERVLLQDKGKLSLDGCAFIQDKSMWFCSAREGYTGLHWFTTVLKDNKWQNWKNTDFPASYEVGELHMTADELYFHSSRAGGKGGLDIWVSKKVNGAWSEPENVANVNSAGDEGWPCISPDGKELWFSKEYSVWRSKSINSIWAAPERMFGPLVGEPSLDAAGNVYFTHHFYRNNTMLEADIYIAEKKH